MKKLETQNQKTQPTKTRGGFFGLFASKKAKAVEENQTQPSEVQVTPEVAKDVPEETQPNATKTPVEKIVIDVIVEPVEEPQESQESQELQESQPQDNQLQSANQDDVSLYEGEAVVQGFVQGSVQEAEPQEPQEIPVEPVVEPAAPATDATEVVAPVSEEPVKEPEEVKEPEAVKEVPFDPKATVATKKAMKAFLQEHQDLSLSEIAEILNINYVQLQEYLVKYKLFDSYKASQGITHGEQDLVDFVKTLDENAVAKDTSVLGENAELTIWSPAYKIGIEYVSTFWHSFEIAPEINLDGKKAHSNTSKLAEKKGIRLIRVYEYEWLNATTKPVIESLLRTAFRSASSKLHARQCDIRKISNEEAEAFNAQYSLYGHKDAQITYGLFYRDKLVRLMSFSKLKSSKNLPSDNAWEIVRGCPDGTSNVKAGASRLLFHFMKEQNPEFVTFNVEIDKAGDMGYEICGIDFSAMCSGETGPEMKWVLPEYKTAARNPRKAQELEEIARGRIYTAGCKKYIWPNEPEAPVDNGSQQ